MLTGQPAFLSEELTSTLARVLETPANLRALPSQVSPAVRRTLELCFEKDPRKRISDMRDVRLALAGAFAHGPVAQPTWRRVLPYAAALALGALLASGYFIGKREPAASPEPVAARPVRFVITPPATAPLAALGGLDLTISADGERIAYFARKPGTGNVELWVRELDELEARPIPESETNAGAENMNPFFSSDGRSIGMFAPGRGIVSVAIDGRPPLKLFDPPSPGFLGAAWLADNTIVFAAGMRLYRVPVNGGGTPEPITEEGQNGVLAAPVLLPGGNAVLVTMLGGSGNSVAMIDLATGELSTLVEDAARPSYVHTGHIVFLRGGTLMAVPFNASELAVTGEAVVLVQGIRRTPGGAADYALSASGTLVYVPGSEETAIASAVVWVDRFGNVIERAVPDLVAGPRDPRLSPDETRLALVTGPSGDGGLWSYDLGGRPRIPLARGDDYRSPVWNPDSRLVTFARGANGGEIFTVPADGSVVTPQVLRAGVGVPRAWSATGELILESWSSRPDIVAIPAATTGEIRTVVASENSEFDPALSADGRWLAYVSNRTGDNEIWVQAYPDGVPVRVSSNGGYEPLWSADGRELFFRQGSAMMTVAIETGDEFSFAPPEQLFTGQYVNYLSAGNRGYDVARDGRFLMFLPGSEDTATVSLSMVVVENFTEELKQLVPSGAQ
jgi:Tol biopolymer transport system component